MDQQSGHAERFQVAAEVGGGKGLCTFKRGTQAGHHGLAARPVDEFSADRVRQQADTEEVLEKAGKEVRAVFTDARGHVVEDRLFGAFWVAAGLQHERHHGSDECRLGDRAAAMARHVARDFTTAHRKADQHRI